MTANLRGKNLLIDLQKFGQLGKILIAELRLCVKCGCYPYLVAVEGFTNVRERQSLLGFRLEEPNIGSWETGVGGGGMR